RATYKSALPVLPVHPLAPLSLWVRIFAGHVHCNDLGTAVCSNNNSKKWISMQCSVSLKPTNQSFTKFL
ncbi:hypothetical protein ACCI51_18450, partial [Microbulbifer echini]